MALPDFSVTIDKPRPYFDAKLRYAVANADVVEAITTAGDTTIPAGTLQEVLQAIADLADPGV